MRLLITTQAVDLDDPILGFFHRWIEEFSKHCESVDVICLRKGSYQLPPNVTVHSLGKETGAGRVVRTLRFLRLAFGLSAKNDAVFAHMNPEYVVLAGWIWRLRGMSIALWYVHRSVTWWLRVAEKFVTVILTAVPESTRLPSEKITVLGHGIDSAALTRTSAPLLEPLDMRTIGRVSESKGIDIILDICDLLHEEDERFKLTVVGAPVTRDEQAFADRMYDRASHAPYASEVTFAGAIRNTDVAQALSGANMFLNISTTGGLDKSVLEAALVGVPVVSTNPTFRTLLAPHGLFVESADAQSVLRAITAFRARPHAEQEAVIETVGAEVRRKHELSALVPAILKALDV